MKSTGIQPVRTALGSSPPSNVQNDLSTASNQLSNEAPKSSGLRSAGHTHHGFRGSNLGQDPRFEEELQA